jgi:hypothetical protein
MAGRGGAEAADELPGAVPIGLGGATESATRGPGAPWGVRGVRRGSTRQMSEGAWGWRLRIVGSWFSGGAGRAPASGGGGGARVNRFYWARMHEDENNTSLKQNNLLVSALLLL